MLSSFISVLPSSLLFLCLFLLVLSDVVTQALKICKAHKIQTNVPPILHRLLSTLTFQEPQSRYQNESRKSRGGGGCKSKPQQVSGVRGRRA